MPMYVSSIFTIIIALVMPIAVFIYLAGKKDRYLKPLVIGALTFLIFQVLTRIPLLQLVLPNMTWYLVLSMTNPVLYALFLGLTAALFEELGRYVMIRWLLKNNRRWLDAWSFGIGHGGLEAVLLVGLNALLTLVLYGGAEMTSPLLMAAAGLERLSAMTMHLGWSIMVMLSIRRKKAGYLLIAVFLHTVLDAGVVFLQQAGLAVLLIEVILLACAGCMVVFIVRAKNYWRDFS